VRVIAKAAAVALITLVGIGSAEAKGCIKGAIIGGLAGHYLAERGVVGAVAGCLAGRALANRRAQREIDYGARVQPRGPGYGAPQRPARGEYGY